VVIIDWQILPGAEILCELSTVTPHGSELKAVPESRQPITTAQIFLLRLPLRAFLNLLPSTFYNRFRTLEFLSIVSGLERQSISALKLIFQDVSTLPNLR
jgi:hypothetical protein